MTDYAKDNYLMNKAFIEAQGYKVERVETDREVGDFNPLDDPNTAQIGAGRAFRLPPEVSFKVTKNTVDLSDIPLGAPSGKQKSE